MMAVFTINTNQTRRSVNFPYDHIFSTMFWNGSYYFPTALTTIGRHVYDTYFLIQLKYNNKSKAN